MFEIINKQILAPNVKRIDVIAPNIARKIKPGQFVSVCPEEDDERIPLTVIDQDLKKGSITLIFQERGQMIEKLGAMAIDDSIFSILGPLGVPVPSPKKGMVICVATGIGIAQILPICKFIAQSGSKVIGVIGAKNKRALMLEAQMRLVCNKLLIATEDGSYESRGKASDILDVLIAKGDVETVYANGSVEMLRNVCKKTKKSRLKTYVHLNPVMVDCMGMCGSCRVTVSGKTVLACIEGPMFDGHKVDFDGLDIRMKAFEESKEWSNQKSELSPKRNESKTLTKFLSGILKN